MDAASNLSVVLITLNEEKRVEACLQSLPKGSEVVVLDSGSTDGTIAIARRAGARVESRKFTDYGEQKNAAIALATRPWVFSVDADEVLSDELRREIVHASNQDDRGVMGYRVKRRLVFMGKRLRFGKSIDYPVRLFRRGAARFESAIHERLVVDGAVGAVTGELSHFSYDDLTDYFTRFNNYTSRIADNHASSGKSMPLGPLHVLRPWSEFLIRYVFRLGFLDGYAGYTYALLSSLYTYVKYAKLRERLIAQKGLPA